MNLRENFRILLCVVVFATIEVGAAWAVSEFVVVWYMNEYSVPNRLGLSEDMGLGMVVTFLGFLTVLLASPYSAVGSIGLVRKIFPSQSPL